MNLCHSRGLGLQLSESPVGFASDKRLGELSSNTTGVPKYSNAHAEKRKATASPLPFPCYLWIVGVGGLEGGHKLANTSSYQEVTVLLRETVYLFIPKRAISSHPLQIAHFIGSVDS